MPLTPDNLHRRIAESQQNICQIVVFRRDRLIFSDQWNGYREGENLHAMSVTKSVVALLVGMAIDHGFISSPEVKVLDFFPDYPVKRGEKTIRLVTIRHLLSMRAPYKGKGDPWTKVCSSPDWTRASLDFLGGRQGLADTFDYRTVCLHILSGILSRAVGMTPVAFANRFLFAPLGIPPRENFFARTAEEHKRFMLDKTPRAPLWFADPQGIATPGYGLCLSASDMARIGLLALHRGSFAGKRILSESWIDDMTRPRPTGSPAFRNMHYGFLWWIVHPQEGIFAAIGNSGNVIYVRPRDQVVVAVASSFRPSVFDRVDFIESFLLPALL